MSIEYNKEKALAGSDRESASGAYDLNARRRAALAEVDNAKFGWFHVKACLVAGVGFYTDAYDVKTADCWHSALNRDLTQSWALFFPRRFSPSTWHQP